MQDGDVLRLSEEDYDFGILHPALRRLYGKTDLYNYGYWRDAAGGRIATLPEAATRLVELHIETDAHRDSARRVLDVGCGLGACTALFAAGYPQAEVVGINYSARQIAHAERHHAHPRVSFRRMDACALDFADRSVDCIHAVEAALHFRPRSAFLAEARRLLVPGGRLILTDILTESATSFVPPTNRLGTVEAYARSLEAAGLQPVALRDIRADTVLPFIEVMRRHAMPAYARGIDKAVSGYLLILATNPG